VRYQSALGVVAAWREISVVLGVVAA